MKTLLLPLAILTMVGSAALAATEGKKPQKVGFQLGVALPTGGDVKDQYGTAWINAKVAFTLKSDAKSRQIASLGIMGGAKKRTFLVSGSEATATGRARPVTIAYTYRAKQAKSPMYIAGTLGLCFVNTSVEYDAGEGRVWDTPNSEKTITRNKTHTTISPELAIGFQVNESSAVELGYTFLNTRFAGNATEYYNLPVIPETKSRGFLSLSGNFNY